MVSKGKSEVAAPIAQPKSIVACLGVAARVDKGPAVDLKKKFADMLTNGNFEAQIANAHKFVAEFVPKSPLGKRAPAREWGAMASELTGLGITTWALPCPDC